MLAKLGMFFIAMGLVKLVIALVLKIKENNDG